MAEIKNSFLKSKMNKDLDDRLVPNGEYRHASNISVGKAESQDVGALETVLGNDKLPLTNNVEFIPGTDTPNPNYVPGLECIGVFMDSQNNRIFQFLTDYTDPAPSSITMPTSETMRIDVYNLETLAYNTLVDGLFLNFAKNKEFKITGVNLIEDLLFWTDNRNQPRKINVNRALGNINYYTTETQISVAKYAPVDPITMYHKVVTQADGGFSGTDTITVVDPSGIVPGMTLLTSGIDGTDYATVASVSGEDITFYEELPAPIADLQELTFLISTMTNKSSDPTWPGDPDFLEDRYVRFSYRFKYDDNEYSLIAPFTQIAYIPKQKGYFIDGNEMDAYRSTVLNWFENNVNNIELIVPLPDKVSNLTNTYKIIEIDIVYKESDSNALKVFESVPISSIDTTLYTSNFYIQPYQSQKPYKTLPENEITRVYDRVPVRAKAQELISNRVVYGNYFDKYTPVPNINYNIYAQPKIPIGTNFIEYPNHTLKKNRNYQVGIILADKYGRQSSVILSSVDLQTTALGANTGSTVYSGYENSVLFTDVKTWFGDTLVMYVNSPITQSRDVSIGTPGLYAAFTNINGFAITALTEGSPNEYTFTLDLTALSSQYVPEVGNILRGKHTDYVTVLTSVKTYQTPGDPLTPITSVLITTSEPINDIYKYIAPIGDAKDIKFAYNYNSIGWYSYKVVVRQQEQDYYNVYLPGILDGYPNNQTSGSQVVYSGSGATATSTLENGINTTQFPVSESGNTSHIVLINDNINKVPRDLSDVGPDQKQYRSSVRLYGRVENIEATLQIEGEVPAYSAKVTTITYDITTVGNENWGLIKPGDGIQCVEANTPIPNPNPLLGGTTPNPYRWLGDVTVVSNDVDSMGIGTITISSPNWVLVTDPNGDPYINFIITRAESRQYFPTRKADTVIAIAYADEFNFLSNSTENISGTAGLNFYQLQNKPLIGRISTVNKIGVKADDMIPFLSVYETNAEESLLDIFWETTSTGLISDLNADVLTGFDGPVGFGGLTYTHFECQDPNGMSETEGDCDSKYITSEFFVLNQSGTPIINTSALLVSVSDNAGNNLRLPDFGLKTIPASGITPTLYRLYIKNPLIFNHDAPTLENYIFRLQTVDTDNPLTPVILEIRGRLGNSVPVVTTSETNYSITQSSTSIVTLTANNGSYSASIEGLQWSIVSGDTPTPSFSLDSLTGALELINPNIPLGTYELEIKVEDAIFSGNPLIDPDSDYATKEAFITLLINVGDRLVDYWLRPIYSSGEFISPGTSCDLNPIAPIGVAYIGKNANPDFDYLPSIPGNSGEYQLIQNIEVKNASPLTIIPTGLTEGEYRFKATTIVNTPSLCEEDPEFAGINSGIKLWLYKRIYNASIPNVWELASTENNVQTSYEIPKVTNLSGSGVTKILTTTFTIEADTDPNNDYEYVIGVQWTGTMLNSSTAPYIELGGEDANYTYADPDYNTPITNSYIYYTGLENVASQTSGIPYTTQDATRGIIYNSPTNAVTSGSLFSGPQTFEFVLTIENQQLVPGINAMIYDSTNTLRATGIVAGINVDGDPKKIAIQLPSVYSGSTFNIAGGNISFNVAGGSVGILYSNTIEGSEIKSFYTDEYLTIKWTPPVPSRYYIFTTDKDYNPTDNANYTKYPYFCAQIDSNGMVIPQVGTTPDAQTAWANGISPTLNNYGYNIYYDESI